MTRDEFHNDPVIDADVDRDPVEQLAEEFLDRRRKGESVSIAEYAERHPDLASRISDLFPTLLLMEELRPSATGAHSASHSPSAASRAETSSSESAISASCVRSAGAAWA